MAPSWMATRRTRRISILPKTFRESRPKHAIVATKAGTRPPSSRPRCPPLGVATLFPCPCRSRGIAMAWARPRVHGDLLGRPTVHPCRTRRARRTWPRSTPAACLRTIGQAVRLAQRARGPGVAEPRAAATTPASALVCLHDSNCTMGDERALPAGPCRSLRHGVLVRRVLEPTRTAPTCHAVAGPRRSIRPQTRAFWGATARSIRTAEWADIARQAA